MTSANVTYYEIYKDGKYITRHSQNCMCKFTIDKRLAKYKPAEDYVVKLVWPDENEADHCSKKMSLLDYLNGVEVTWEEE